MVIFHSFFFLNVYQRVCPRNHLIVANSLLNVDIVKAARCKMSILYQDVEELFDEFQDWE